MSNKKENTFVIIPPEKGSSVFLVKSKGQFEKETKLGSSYLETLDLIFFNKEGVLSEKEHFAYLESILPPLAIILQTDFSAEIKDIIEMFLSAEDDEAPHVKAFGSYDYTTSIVFILMKYLSDYSELREESGVEAADLKYRGINEILTLAFMKLPFFLISSLSTKYSRRAIKKANKKTKK
jgi:hypothetical protein